MQREVLFVGANGPVDSGSKKVWNNNYETNIPIILKFKDMKFSRNF